MSGWIKLHRKLSDNPLWTAEPFTRGQAWVDLILLANYEDSFFYIRGIKVNVARGQLAWAEQSLANRWRWSRTKLRKFLKDLEKEQQIIQQKTNVIQTVTVLNYEEYQNKEPQNRQQKDSRKTHNKKNKEIKECSVNDFYKKQIADNENKEYIDKYKQCIDILFGNTEQYDRFDVVLGLSKQLTYKAFQDCYLKIVNFNKKQKKDIKLLNVLTEMEANGLKGKKDFSAVLRTFVNNKIEWSK